MKRILFTILIFFSIVKPSYPMEAPVGIINDPFFVSPGTMVSIRTIVPHAETYMAIVDGTTQTESRSTSLVPFHTKTFIHIDQYLWSRTRVDATVLCGTKTLLHSITPDATTPYILVREFEDKRNELVLGARVEYFRVKEFRRPDQTIYHQFLQPALYEVSLKEVRVAIPDVTVCTKEWVITSQWQRKTRHRRNHYYAHDVYRITTKHFSGGLIPDEELTRTYLKKELRFRLNEEESPECGQNGGNLPIGAVIL